MNTISYPPLYARESGPFGTVQVSQSSRTTFNASVKTEISLVTADGDRVTLSARSAWAGAHTTYDYLGRIEGQALAAHAETFQISSSSELAVKVEGELDQEELADLNKVLEAIEATAAAVFSGKPAGLLKSFADLGESDSWTSFDAALNYSRSASTEREARLAAGGETPAGDAVEAASTNGLSEPRSMKPFLKKLSQIARRLEDEKSLDKLPKRFARLFNKLAHNLSLDEHEQRLADRIHSEHLKRQ